MTTTHRTHHDNQAPGTTGTGGGKIHELKMWPEYFEKILSGEKTFEIRKNDRDFKVGDILFLRECIVGGYPDKTHYYTDRKLSVTVTYILHGTEETSSFGVSTGSCIMGIKQSSPTHTPSELVEKYTKELNDTWKDILLITDPVLKVAAEVHVNFTKMVLSDLKSQTVKEDWISVEKKPEEGKRVLCLTSSGYMSVGYYYQDTWERNDNNGAFESMGYTITHWRYLPEKPINKQLLQ